VAASLAGSEFAQEVIELAGRIRSHRFPLLGAEVDTGREIRWRRDYARRIETGLEYFRRIPYLDAQRAGDHKRIWELNRHQHLVTLAQAYLFTGDRCNLDEIHRQLESWSDQNPFGRGVNWASALEVALRALSWTWLYHWVGVEMPDDLRQRWLTDLFRHGCFIENNLSIYFSPNTHLLGEALALHALGLFFRPHPKAGQWRRIGARIVKEQMECQVHQDGSYIERSSYYHVYALDMFLLHAALSGPEQTYLEKARRMADYLDALLGPARRLPLLGDDDGGRLFHPFGATERAGPATLATAAAVLHRDDWTVLRQDASPQAAWWTGAAPGASRASRHSGLFPDAGVASMVAEQNQVIVSAGAFGPWRAGHSHADALSIVARSGGEEILADPGTYTYTGEPAWRDWFRATAAHNTIRIDCLDQATAAGPFGWRGHPRVRLLAWTSDPAVDFLEAECSYRGFTHRRRVEFQKPGLLIVIDDVWGPPGEHEIEQNWQLGSVAAAKRMVFSEPAEQTESWRSLRFGEKQRAPAVRVRRRCHLPLRLETRIGLNP